MEKKSNGGLITIIIILVIALLGLSFYVAYDKGLIFNNEEEVVEKDKTEEDEENDVTESTLTTLKIEDGNCINDSTLSYSITSDDSLSSIIVTDNNTVSLRISDLSAWALTNYDTNYLTVNINNFSQEVVDVITGGLSQEIGTSTIIFLMEDGTLEYIPLYKALQTGNIQSYGKLEGVEGIVKLYSVSAFPKNSPIGGHYTILAQKADGTYYDLRPILMATGNY